MTTKNGAIAPDGIGLPEKSLTVSEVLDFCLEQIHGTTNVNDWEMECYMALGRMDAMVLVGAVPYELGKDIAALPFDKASDHLLYIKEAEHGRN